MMVIILQLLFQILAEMLKLRRLLLMNVEELQAEQRVIKLAMKLMFVIFIPIVMAGLAYYDTQEELPLV